MYICVTHRSLYKSSRSQLLVGLWELASSDVRTHQRSSAIQHSTLWLADIKASIWSLIGCWSSGCESCRDLHPAPVPVVVQGVHHPHAPAACRGQAGRPGLRTRGEWPERVKCSAEHRGGHLLTLGHSGHIITLGLFSPPWLAVPASSGSEGASKCIFRHG